MTTVSVANAKPSSDECRPTSAAYISCRRPSKKLPSGPSPARPSATYDAAPAATATASSSLGATCRGGRSGSGEDIGHAVRGVRLPGRRKVHPAKEIPGAERGGPLELRPHLGVGGLDHRVRRVGLEYSA